MDQLVEKTLKNNLNNNLVPNFSAEPTNCIICTRKFDNGNNLEIVNLQGNLSNGICCKNCESMWNNTFPQQQDFQAEWTTNRGIILKATKTWHSGDFICQGELDKKYEIDQKVKHNTQY